MHDCHSDINHRLGRRCSLSGRRNDTRREVHSHHHWVCPIRCFHQQSLCQCVTNSSVQRLRIWRQRIPRLDSTKCYPRFVRTSHSTIPPRMVYLANIESTAMFNSRASTTSVLRAKQQAAHPPLLLSDDDDHYHLPTCCHRRGYASTAEESL